jgi:hypothetical protein
MASFTRLAMLMTTMTLLAVMLMTSPVTLMANLLFLTVYGWAFRGSLFGEGPLVLENLGPYFVLVYIPIPTLLAGAWAWRFWLPKGVFIPKA